MQTTRNIDKTTRTVRQMAEVQRDSYEALADNLAGAQRRTIGLAEGGFKLMRLQEENARVTQEWFANSLRLATLLLALDVPALDRDIPVLDPRVLYDPERPGDAGHRLGHGLLDGTVGDGLRRGAQPRYSGDARAYLFLPYFWLASRPAYGQRKQIPNTRATMTGTPH